MLIVTTIRWTPQRRSPRSRGATSVCSLLRPGPARPQRRAPRTRGATGRCRRAWWPRPKCLNEGLPDQEERQHPDSARADLREHGLARGVGAQRFRFSGRNGAFTLNPGPDLRRWDTSPRRSGGGSADPSHQTMKESTLVMGLDRPSQEKVASVRRDTGPRSQMRIESTVGAITAASSCLILTSREGAASTTKTLNWTRSPNPSRTRASAARLLSSGRSYATSTRLTAVRLIVSGSPDRPTACRRGRPAPSAPAPPLLGAK